VFQRLEAKVICLLVVKCWVIFGNSLSTAHREHWYHKSTKGYFTCM